LRLAVVDWAGVGHASKLQRAGLPGALSELHMVSQIVSHLSATGLVRQNLALGAARIA
jgi:hypothetical protein